MGQITMMSTSLLMSLLGVTAVTARNLVDGYGEHLNYINATEVTVDQPGWHAQCLEFEMAGCPAGPAEDSPCGTYVTDRNQNPDGITCNGDLITNVYTHTTRDFYNYYYENINQAARNTGNNIHGRVVVDETPPCTDEDDRVANLRINVLRKSPFNDITLLKGFGANWHHVKDASLKEKKLKKTKNWASLPNVDIVCTVWDEPDPPVAIASSSFAETLPVCLEGFAGSGNGGSMQRSNGGGSINSKEMTFEEAEADCAGRNARMCRLEELEFLGLWGNKLDARGKRCGYGSYHGFWSSTTCSHTLPLLNSKQTFEPEEQRMVRWSNSKAGKKNKSRERCFVAGEGLTNAQRIPQNNPQSNGNFDRAYGVCCKL